MLNKRKLQACMKLYGDTTGSLAEALGIAISTMSCKINGKIIFNLNDIRTIALRYELSPHDIVDIFLGEDVTNCNK